MAKTQKKMLIDAQDPEELRVAVVEDGKLEAFYVEAAAAEQTRGNIYKGVVINVEPSLEAAFLDYGVGRHGFLQLGDLRPDALGEPTGNKSPKLRRGDQLLIQVAKEPTGNKGASLTTYLSIPGQYLVLTPGHEASGVSRQIADEAERSRLKDVLAELKRPPRTGVIARTAAEGRPKREIKANFAQLKRVWQDIERRAKNAKAPCLINKEEELAVRTVRDLFTAEVSEIMVDDPEVFERVKHFIGLVSPRRKQDVSLHRGPKPIFHKFQIEQQIETIYHPLVHLPSGGSIVINPTEALVAVDVNSHKAHKGKEIEDTALNVNLEAAAEVARQLRLRDLGGLVVVDFIDMRDRKNRAKVRSKMREELKKDKAKTEVGNISRFGLLELSRQRIRPPIDFGDTRTCPHCEGRGLLRTREAVGRMVLRNLGTHLGHDYKDGLRMRLNPEVADYLLNNKRYALAKLECAKEACLELVADENLKLEDMRIERITGPWQVPSLSVDGEPSQDLPTRVQPEQAAGGSDTAKPAPKRQRRRRSSKPKQDQPRPEAPAKGPESEAGQDKPAPKRRRRRRSPKPKPNPEQANQKAAAPPEPKPASKSEASSSEAPSAEAKPKPARRRRRRSGAARRRARKAAERARADREA